MSVLPLTASVIQALRTDFRQGSWSATTQQFFQQLFDRVGGASALTNAELTAALAQQQAALDTAEAEIEVLEMALASLQAEVESLVGVQEFGVAPLGSELPDVLSAVVAARAPARR
jgi:hypothetical protein